MCCRMGSLAALPLRDKGAAIRLSAVISELRDQHALSAPILLRFLDILRDRVTSLHEAFDKARHAHHYRAPFHPVYPVKVNQRRSVVETVLASNGLNGGLEVGSKPELMQALALAPAESMIVCNGYKDAEYVQLALTGQRLGLQIFIVVEKFSELEVVRAVAADMAVEPLLGLRVRLQSATSGNWQNTGGRKSKFGLYAAEILRSVHMLSDAGLLPCLRMLHFHIGSQIPDIKHFQSALREGARYYAALRQMQAPISWVDVGGGLAVDYDGTASDASFSMNYTMDEYADSVVHAFSLVCSELDLPPPAIVTECGRAMTAHHAMVITNVTSVEHPPLPDPVSVDEQAPALIQDLAELCRKHTSAAALSEADAVRLYQEAEHKQQELQKLFTHGQVSLTDIATGERLYYSACRHAYRILATGRHELARTLSAILADKYYCNFSLFHTMPDSWALGQIFPIMPLSNLSRLPERRATLHDLTCDSDGRVDRYACHGRVEETLPVHELMAGEPYHIGLFLVGAYQEILGDIHNLFGEVASANVELADNEAGYVLTGMHCGSTAADLLRQVGMMPEQMLEEYGRKTQRAGLSERQTRECLDVMTAGLYGYTYLLEPPS